MNILAVIILGVLLLNVLSGYQKGFLKTAFSLFSWVLVLIISSVATPMVTQLLIETTDIEIVIQEALDQEIEKMLAETMEKNVENELQDVLPEDIQFEIPEELQAVLPEELRDALQSGITEVDGMKSDVIDTSLLVERVVSMVALLIVVVFSRVALSVVDGALGIASKLPLIGSLDKLIGLVFGTGMGFVWTWVILAVVSVLSLTGVSAEWAGYIAESQMLTWFQDNNLILQMFVK